MNKMLVTSTPVTGTPVDLARQTPRTVTGFQAVIETAMDLEDVRPSLEEMAERSAFRLVALAECGDGPVGGGRLVRAEFVLRARRGSVGDLQIFALLREIAGRHRWNAMEKRLAR
jgi:hypothetical protein